MTASDCSPDLEWLSGPNLPAAGPPPAGSCGKGRAAAAGTSLMEALEEAGGLHGDGLFVLGEPGAGKTTLLFQLARQLAERAHADPRTPAAGLPAAVHLVERPCAARRSGWSTQLEELYQVPRALARRWTDEGRLLFLLDGLDEIPDRDDRVACVMAINQFTRFGRIRPDCPGGDQPPVEYDALPVQLQLEAAISVRPLDPTVVLEDLERASRAAGRRRQRSGVIRSCWSCCASRFWSACSPSPTPTFPRRRSTPSPTAPPNADITS